eukprot:CAMPEP_0197854900 /NCGR_PEP_ID=MMETSP1438-20131217/25552_1 /TAXON_ID=1461541 /ORGANISM="Pterosperma sp., Strain CCMP1384" /LENGTH=217 /DNA_ID=CAMNT_0043469809 /DNA_START=128 /DNA_END=778 /DNA_ORIENTATION=-
MICLGSSSALSRCAGASTPSASHGFRRSTPYQHRCRHRATHSGTGLSFGTREGSCSTARVTLQVNASSQGDGSSGPGDFSESEFKQGSDEDALAAMQRDIELLKQKEEADRAAGLRSESAAEAAERRGPWDEAKDNLDKFLLYDFFVICFILVWLVIGATVRLASGGISTDEPVLGLWLFLWPWLFQPILGVHMLATIVSGGIDWAKRKNLVSEDTW